MRLRLSLHLLFALLCLTAVYSEAQSETHSRAGVQESFEQPFQKSKGTAYILSFLGTGIPLLMAAQLSASTHGGSEAWIGGMVLGGVILGPSLGQFYAGSHAGGWLGAGIRTGGLFVTALGLAQFSERLFCSEEEESGCDDGGKAAPYLIPGGIALFIGGTIYSFVNAGRTVERFNDSQSRLGDFGWSPAFAPGSGGAWKSGAIAWMRF